MLFVVNKKIFLVLITLFLVLILAVAFLYMYSFRQGLTVKKNIDGQKKLQERRLNEVKKYDLALVKNETNLCQEITEGGLRNLCFEKIAIALANSSICQRIENKQDQDRCFFIIFKNKALEEKNSKFCQQIGSQSLIEQCVNQVEQKKFCQTEECLQSLNQ